MWAKSSNISIENLLLDLSFYQSFLKKRRIFLPKNKYHDYLESF